MRRIIVALALICTSAISFAQNPFQYLLIGTNADGKDGGIFVYRFNPNKGEATLVSHTETGYPTYLAVSHDQKYVYAVNEYPGSNDGDVSAFALDKPKGQLTLLNKQTTAGASPCYVSVDSTGKNVVVANYNGGNLSLFKTGADGSLQPALQTIGHEGYGVNVQRQEMPHVHSVVFTPDEKFLFAPNLGNDRVYKYKFNATDATTPLTDGDPQYYTLEDGYGPRHITFSADGKYAYVMTELSSKLLVYENKDGQFTEIQSLPTAKVGDKNDMGGADIHITPNGKFLYVSIRGKANEIVIYKVNTDGKLLEVGHQPVGLHPRNFMIDPTGRFLLVANRDSNNVQIFIINKNYGLLEDTHTTIQVNKPVCLKMVPVK
ncbi:6-phosphogluconolactonase [Filimonas lacunae]|uniref:6-phosphogluconolactonase n=1 Tax=Filimonas lacunae TaxID=477680 RepID=A0A173MM27_9BACT|nr:lactonase family protein [Filimonas lacunae]BAV08536.1 6-phosphogluconolactonase [Filimonas lacunae]SIT34097.1 6-phosphogluconolactonase [Filimonas lacunae]